VGHRSEIGPESGKRPAIKQTASDEPALPIGEEMDFKIIKISEAQKRIGLSLRAITEEDEQNRLQDYKRQAVAATSTVGDAIKQHKLEENR
jgi:small subunit ribosomal protein S1